MVPDRWRVIRTLLIFLVAILLVLYVASRLFILSSFEDLEKQLVRTQIDRVRDAVSARLDTLSSKTGDWAMRDDTYAFIAGENPQFAETEITDATLAQLGINVMVFVKPTGKIAFFKAFDLEEEQPVPFQPIDKIRLDEFLKTLDLNSRLTGFILLPDHPLLIAARPIVKSDGTGPARGVLLFGRYLDTIELAHLVATTHLSFNVHRIDQPLAQDDLRAVVPHLSTQTPQIVQPLSDKTIAGYAIMNDIYETPALLLQVEQARNVYQQAWTSTLYFILAITAIAWTFATVVYIMRERLMQAHQKERASQQLYYSLAEAAPDALYVVDNQMRIKFANQAAKHTFEDCWAEMVGQVNHQDSPDEPGRKIAKVLETKTPLHFERELKPFDQNAWLDIHLVPLQAESNTLDSALCIARDITERKQTETRMQRQFNRLEALHTIDQAITSGLDLTFTLNVLLAQTQAHLNVDAADVLLCDNQMQNLTVATSSGFVLGNGKSNYCTFEDGLAGRAMVERKHIEIQNLHKPRLGLQRYETFAAEKFVSGFAAPLISRGKVRGVLEVFLRAHLNPDREWLEFLVTLAGQAAIAVDSIETFKTLQHTSTELVDAYDSTLEGWAHALDLRDGETEGHTQRVAEMSVLLAHSFGIDDSELIHIRRGALLHDMGKMAIPDTILLKPGPLTDAEWTIMRKHPVHAFNMLESIPFLLRALPIPYCHHEKWDGTGYPHGLKGEKIPLAARIFAVVDVWDALRSDRLYRAAWTTEKAKEYVRDQSGKHFDPQAVRVFLQYLERQEN